MVKLTRLNHGIVAINPDLIAWADETPDTTLCLIDGQRILVRESLETLIDLVVAFRRRVRGLGAEDTPDARPGGFLHRPDGADAVPHRPATRPPSGLPRAHGEGG